MRIRSRFLPVLLLAVAMAVVAGPAAGADAEGPAQNRRLLAALPPGVHVSRDRASGAIRALRGGRAPVASARSLGHPATPVAAARAFLARSGGLWGVMAPARELRVTRVHRLGQGGSTVRYQQRIDGVPVLGGDLVVVVDRRHNVRAVRGETTRDRHVDTRPRISRAAARTAAREAVARATGTPAVRLRAATPSLWILDPVLLDAPGLPRARLVWRTSVRDDARTVDQFVAVDARSGDVALRFDQRPAGAPDDAAQRICDQQDLREQVRDRLPCKASQQLAMPYTGEASRAAQATEATYDLFRLRFGYDLPGDLGTPLISTVRYCPRPAGGGCPYRNAFWDGTQMVYGAGFASADDVVGHELSHAVTERASDLFYYMQSGAINESLSDVFGEAVDQTNDFSFDDDAPGRRWRMGEDLVSVGVLRNMADPTLFGHPDRVDSPLWDDDPAETDGGGVHSNSGVGNRAFFLLVDGPDPIDPDRDVAMDQALAIWYRAASTLLTTASDYADLADSLRIACDQLAGVSGAVRDGTGAASTDISAADCGPDGALEAAIATTRMAWELRTTGPKPSPLCTDPGAVPTFLLDDPIDAGATGWTFDAEGPNRRWFLDDTYGYRAPDAGPGAPPWHLFGLDLGQTADRRIRRTSDVAIPAGGRPVFLWFRHAYGFDDGSEDAAPNDNGYDGGVVEASASGGAWVDIGPLFVRGAPTGRIFSGDTNPLGGRTGYTAESGGYVTARAVLSGHPGLGFGGADIRLGFRIGTDSSYAGEGWFIDDVRVYRCVNDADLDAPSVGPLAVRIPLGGSAPDDRVPVQVDAAVDADPGVHVNGVTAAPEGGPETPVGGSFGARSVIGTLAATGAVLDLVWTATDENGDSDVRGRALRVRLRQETAFSYSGTWTSRSGYRFSGDAARSTGAAGRTASIVVMGEDIAVIAPTGPDRGRARMCLDGASCRTVDLYSTSARPARVVATWNRSGSASRTVTIRVLGTRAPASTGTRVDVDAIGVLGG